MCDCCTAGPGVKGQHGFLQFEHRISCALILSRAPVDHPEVSNASFRLTSQPPVPMGTRPLCVVVALGRWEREEELQK